MEGAARIKQRDGRQPAEPAQGSTCGIAGVGGSAGKRLSAERKKALEIAGGADLIVWGQEKGLGSGAFRQDLVVGALQCAADTDPDVRVDAVRMLGRCDQFDLLNHFSGQAIEGRVPQAIVAAIDDSDARVRMAAMLVLAESRGQLLSRGDACSVLARRVQTDSRDEAVLAWRALARQCSNNAIPLEGVPGFGGCSAPQCGRRMTESASRREWSGSNCTVSRNFHRRRVGGSFN